MKQFNVTEEFERFIDEEEGIPKMCNTSECIAWGVDIAHHFAEWQKQQMMKDVVEVEVRGYMTGVGVYVEADIPIGIDVNEGDKVKIIIVKEE